MINNYHDSPLLAITNQVGEQSFMLVAGHLQVAVSSAAAARCSAVLGDATVETRWFERSALQLVMGFAEDSWEILAWNDIKWPRMCLHSCKPTLDPAG